MRSVPLSPFLFLGLLFLFHPKGVTGTYHIYPFLPFLTICFIRLPLPKLLWSGVLAGVIVDLFTSLYPFGTHALLFTLALFTLNKCRLFPREQGLGPLFCATLLSSLITCLELGFLHLRGITLPFTRRGIVTDLLLMPLADGIITLIAFLFLSFSYATMRKARLSFPFFRKGSKRGTNERTPL
ncbi:MAG: hypothetical protein OXF02_07355 [Simkaniaceae bacterium]|nr:hypothetical protein [Simkaniaceae bacterium]